MKDQERDMMRKIILNMVSKGAVHWTDLQKKVLATCHPFATSHTFNSQLRYLVSKGFIEKVSRGIYYITKSGETLLSIL